MRQFWLKYFTATEKSSLVGLPERTAALKDARRTDAVGGDSLTPELGIADIMCD